MDRMPWAREGGTVSRLLPELICSDLPSSLVFYHLLGFAVECERPLERFVYLTRGDAHLMLEQPFAQDRLYPQADLVQPYGRGINLTLDVDDVEGLCTVITAAGHRLHLPLEERWYDRFDDAVGVRQFAVQDPDGYLFRVSQNLGTKALR